MAASSAAAGPFDQYKGRWTGTGTVSVGGYPAVDMQCTMTYFPKDDRMSFTLRCKSSHYRLEVKSKVQQTNNRVTGSWQETGFNLGGGIRGTHRASQFNVTTTGMFGPDVSGRTSGDVQDFDVKSRLYSMRIHLERR